MMLWINASRLWWIWQIRFWISSNFVSMFNHLTMFSNYSKGSKVNQVDNSKTFSIHIDIFLACKEQTKIIIKFYWCYCMNYTLKFLSVIFHERLVFTTVLKTFYAMVELSRSWISTFHTTFQGTVGFDYNAHRSCDDVFFLGPRAQFCLLCHCMHRLSSCHL